MLFPGRKVSSGALRIFICNWRDLRNFADLLGCAAVACRRDPLKTSDVFQTTAPAPKAHFRMQVTHNQLS